MYLKCVYVTLAGHFAKWQKISDENSICSCIHIADVDRGCSDPRSVIAVVVNVKGTFYKNKTWCFKQLYSRSEFSILHEKLTLESVGT